MEKERQKQFGFWAGGAFILFVLLYFAVVFWNNHRHKSHLILYGNVDIRQANLGFRVSGRLKKMLVEEGDEVKKGDLLAVLDKAPYKAALDLAEGQLAEAEATYQKLKNGSRPQEIEEARATYREQEAAAKNAEILFERIKKQRKVGASSQQDYDNALAQKLETEALRENSKWALNLALEGFRPEDIQGGFAAWKAAQAQRDEAEINLQDTEIHAPSDGIIFTRVQEPGAILAPQSVVYTLSLQNPIWIRAYVSETDLGRIKPGMKAEIYTDSYPGKAYSGHIGFISPQAEFTPKTVETPELRTDLVYRLRIYVTDSKGELRQGMPVTAKLLLAQ